MLDHHPEMCVANDTHFIPRCLEKTDPASIDVIRSDGDLPLSPALADCVQGYHRFPRLGIPLQVVDEAARAATTYRDFVSRLYTQFGVNQGKLLAGEKTPDYVRHLPLLHALLPWIKTVHIVRDGRDVALSVLQWAHEKKGPGRLALWREQPLAVCALWWRWLVRTGRRDGQRLGAEHYLEVQYEALVRRPADTLARIADFLQVSCAPEMLAYHEGKAQPGSGQSAKKAWLPPTPGLRDWRTQMARRDRQLFEALAGDTLAELGYELPATDIPPEVAAVADAARRWWRDHGPGGGESQQAMSADS